MDDSESISTVALREAISKAGGRASLRRQLNERGHEIKSDGVVGQWLISGVPAPYAPDIEDLTGIACERLCPKVKWGLVRDRRSGKRQAKAA